jgi:hypothetical protein
VIEHTNPAHAAIDARRCKERTEARLPLGRAHIRWRFGCLTGKKFPFRAS